ncbi:MAG TPA: sulfotransferase [Solirubrobacterales bacterium]|nr:sulfotransferase [Solirubrobacterales bacterium]
MNVFLLGMRRSGTTILYDAFGEDPELQRFYEPFREEAETVGGGSGARAEDLFAETREVRRQFQREVRPEVPLELFNHGGPRAPGLELHPALPEWGVDFIRHLLDLAPESLIKEVRLFRKVPDLHRIDPGAALVHIVRDPRAVAGSMLLGRGRRHAPRFDTADEFFDSWSRRKLWSSSAIAKEALATGEHPNIVDGVPDFMRPLIVWKAAWDGIRSEGRRLFGDRYVLVRLENLRVDPEGELHRIYDSIGRSTPDGVRAWAGEHVRRDADIVWGEDPRWAEAIGLLRMEEAITDAGYKEILELKASARMIHLESPDARSPSRLDAAVGRARRAVERATGRGRS